MSVLVLSASSVASAAPLVFETYDADPVGPLPPGWA
jgi:hypothetical protein